MHSRSDIRGQYYEGVVMSGRGESTCRLIKWHAGADTLMTAISFTTAAIGPAVNSSGVKSN